MIMNKKTETILSIMEIERFAIHDGPGIRTIVFLQGCPLHCPWCSNPESQQINTRLMHLKNHCVGCGECVKACPEQAITIEDGKARIDRSICTLCKVCENSCLPSAIKFIGKKYTAPQIMEVLLKDKDYYRESGGGITFSGGEAFVQFKGLMKLLELCKSEGLHTAVETCGQVELSKIKKSFPFIDLFFFDIKHTDSQILKSVTGADWSTISTNLDYISEQDSSKIILRVPVLPGFNYTEKSLMRIFELALDKNIRTIHLLPYHTLGKNKYHHLDIPYTFLCDDMMTKKELAPYKSIGERLGLTIQIGG